MTPTPVLPGGLPGRVRSWRISRGFGAGWRSERFGGSAKAHLPSVRFESDGELSINTAGRLETFGQPTGATGVRMVYEKTL